MRQPILRRHKASNRAYVFLDGRERYCGPWGSAEAQAEFHRIVSLWLANGCKLPTVSGPATCAEVISQYLDHANRIYPGRRHGRKQLCRITHALSGVTTLFAGLPADLFRPKALRTVRQTWINAGFTRDHINKRVYEIVAAWRWAAGEELVPGTLVADLAAVRTLRKGDPGVSESPPRLSVPAPDFGRVVRLLREPWRSLAILQWLTGMRPSEALALTWDSVDQSADVWIYRPKEHKCDWRGQGREVLLGPRARRFVAVVAADGPPAPSKISRYANAVKLACEAAGVVPWTPYALRHTAATRFSVQFGPDIARRLLGQRSVRSFERYDHLDLKTATDIARRAG